MRRILQRIGWGSLASFFGAAMMAAGMSFVSAPAQAAFELPEGEKITNVPAIPRAIPQKEAYELYDPRIGKNFDISKFWLRADLRVRPETRNGVCFGGGNPSGGACNGAGSTTTAAVGTVKTANGGKAASDQFVQQMTRLGIGYDLSPDVNFYFELIDSNTWGTNGLAGTGGAQVSALNMNGSANCSATGGGGGNCSELGVRAAYMLIRNFAGVQGLSVKAGRQYVVFGSHSLFGHFDWANTGFSHDGIMLQYSTKAWDTWAGWFRESEGDMQQAGATGSIGGNVVGGGNGQQNGGADTDLFIFYNQIKSVPGFIIEPYYVYYKNNNPNGGTATCAPGTTLTAGALTPACAGTGNEAQGLGTAKHSNQTRHMVGNRIEMRKGNFDGQNEVAYQFGAMGDSMQGNPAATTGVFTPNQNSVRQDCAANQKCLHINAWATRNWVGYTAYNMAWKPRLAANFDYATGDGRANCTINGGRQLCSSANTFENFYPTNHIHMGYMDVQSWKNMMSPSANLQARPTKDDHVEIWYTNLNLSSAQDNWYRGTQGVYVFSKADNTKTHIGDEIDFTWTHLFMDGKVAFQATYATLFAGGYIQHNLGTSANQNWAYAQLWINF
jgi:hypothetical protein